MSAGGADGPPRAAADGELMELAAGLRTEIHRLAYHLRGPAARSGITPSRLAALAALSRSPHGLRQSDLAGQLGLSAPSMTRLVDVLLETDLVVRERSAEDQRAWIVRLSANGERSLAEVRTESTAELTDDLAVLSAADRRALARALPVLRGIADARLVPGPVSVEANPT